MESPLVSINLVVRNGEKYIRHCLDSIKKQKYQNLELNILDNDSADQTPSIIKNEYPEFTLIKSPNNLAMWGGQEKLLEHSHGKYIVAISVDIILDENFIKNAADVMERDQNIGALQPKIYQYRLVDIDSGRVLDKKTIDTCGFRIFRSRRVINIGHGEKEDGQYDQEMNIFGVEGAVPVLRREAIEDARIQGHFTDEDFWWYTDDLDFAWRMQLLGWKQIFAPSVIAYHDRQTTRSVSNSKLDFIKMRRGIPFFKRALDFRNTFFTIIKNDHWSNIIRDLPYILKRAIPLFGYYAIFETKLFFQLGSIVRTLPRMVQKRKLIMQRARSNPVEMRQWFHNG